MLGRGDRQLLVSVVVLGLVLTGLTVWAVYSQGQSLRKREWQDLEGQAGGAAARRRAQFRADCRQAIDSLTLNSCSINGLRAADGWAAGHAEWYLSAVRGPDEEWTILPQTWLAEPVPAFFSPPVTEPASADPRDALDYLRRLAASADPLTRASALLAAGACEQQLGNPLGAARTFAEAAQLLRSTPGLSRFGLRAEISRIEALLAAGDLRHAHASLHALVVILLADHPGRPGSAGCEELRRLARRLALRPDDEILLELDRLERRAARRVELENVFREQLSRSSDISLTEPDDLLISYVLDSEPLVVVQRVLDGTSSAALAVPLRTLFERYWRPVEPDAPWRFAARSEMSRSRILVDLRPEFANSVLEPTPPVLAGLRATQQRWLGLLALVGLGTVGAWTLVIWMLFRALAHQRALVRLQRRFVADVSHELKTPLALIRLLAETLAGQRVRDPDRAQGYLETIIRESERLSVLLETILDFSRMESGRKKYEWGECDVGAVARQAWSLFEPQFRADNFDAQLELPEDLPLIQADGQALQQVMVNLLQNAHRYAGDRKYVRLRIRCEGYLLFIIVEDRGIGMSPTQLERLGDSFVRGEDTRVRQTRGAGLGLAIVDHIVVAHGGKLEVQSRPGQGSTFTVWLPVRGPDAAETHQ